MTAASLALDAAEAAQVRALVTDACLEMFATFGSPVSVVDDDAVTGGSHDIAGFIGFSGRIRGSLMMSASGGLFRSSYPDQAGAPVSVADLIDWAGEAANQLLGRIKRRFCDRGVDLKASTPTAVRGREIGRRFPARQGACDLLFAVGSDFVSVCFEVRPDADGKVFGDATQPIAHSQEGDLVEF
jgi:CheY-specific phosphatase CheX